MFKFKTDSETTSLLEIIKHFLIKYFHHTEIEAYELINLFHQEKQNTIYWTDDSYHHEGSFRMAALIHYCVFLKGDLDVFWKWEKDNNYHIIPTEAFEYYKDNYFTDY